MAASVAVSDYVPLSVRYAGGAALMAWKLGATYDECQRLVHVAPPSPEQSSDEAASGTAPLHGTETR